jgi:hypothetical protein
MASADRFIPRFAAEPPQEGLPYGRWADRLAEEFLAACARASAGGSDAGPAADTDAGSGAEADPGASTEIGRPGDITWYPDRTWHGHTYVPATTITDRGFELFGYVRFAPVGEEGGEPDRFEALADYTEETAERNPDWKLDVCDEVIGSWRGHGGRRAAITLVWGRALVPGGQSASAELGGTPVDRCDLEQERFTLIAPDDYDSDLLEIALHDARGRELARVSLSELGVGVGEGDSDPR